MGFLIAAVSGVIETRNFRRDNKNSFEVNRCVPGFTTMKQQPAFPKR